MLRVRYRFAHEWESPRSIWEDVYLLVDEPRFAGPGIHLTVVGVGDARVDAEDRSAAVERLAGREYVIDREAGDMYVHTDDFTKAELLEWTRVFLEDIGVSADQLVEAPLSFFVGRIAHADFVEALVKRSGELSGDGGTE